MDIFKNLSLHRIPKGLLVVLACNAGYPLADLECSSEAFYPQESIETSWITDNQTPSEYSSEELEYYDPEPYSQSDSSTPRLEEIEYYDPQRYGQPASTTDFAEATDYYDPQRYGQPASPTNSTESMEYYTQPTSATDPLETVEYYDPSKYSSPALAETTQEIPQDTPTTQHASDENLSDATFTHIHNPASSGELNQPLSKESAAASYPFDGYYPVAIGEEAAASSKAKIAQAEASPAPTEPMEEKPSTLAEGKGNIKFVKKAPEINSETQSESGNAKTPAIIGKQVIAEPAVGYIEKVSAIDSTIAASEEARLPVQPIQKAPSIPASESPANLVAQSQTSTIPQQSITQQTNVEAAAAPATATPATPRSPTVITPTTPDPNAAANSNHVATAGPHTLKEISINFNNVSMIEYIRFISRISNKNFIFDDEDLQFNVTIVSEEPTTVENLMAALLQELRIRDLSLIEQGNNIMIHRNPRVKSPARIVSDGNVLITSRISELVTRVFRLNTLDPVKASEIIRPLLSEDALVEVLRDTNNIVITDLVTNVNKVTQLISTLDAPNSGVTIGQYVVRNGFVETLVDLTTKILQPIAQGNPFTLVPHVASNSIFIVSNSFLVEKALAILQNLDLNEGRTKILSLEKLHPTNVPGYGGPGGGGGPGGRGGPGGFGQAGAVPGGIGSAGFAPGVNPENYPGGAFGEGGLGVGGQYNPENPEAYPYGGFGSAGFNPANPESYAFGPGGIGTQPQLTPQGPNYPEGRLGTEGEGRGPIPYGAPGYQGEYGGRFPGGGIGTEGQEGLIQGNLPYEQMRGGLGTEGRGYYLPNGEFVPGLPGGGGIAPGGIGSQAGGYYLPNGEFVPGRLGAEGRPEFEPGFRPGVIGSEGRPNIFDEGRDFLPGGISSASRWTRELPTGHIERTLFFIYKLRYRKGDQIEIALRKIGMSLQMTGTANADLISAINSSQWLESSNSLIFTGTALALEKIKELILEVDVPLRQVFIEMLILETDIADSLTYGVDWVTKFGGGNTSGEQGFLGLETGLVQAAETVKASGGIVQSIIPQATNLLDASVGLAGYSAAIIGTHLTHGGTHFSTIGALVQAIHNDAKTNILLNPKIITEDNNTAEIFVGGVDRYKTQSITNDLGSLVTNNFQFLDVGVSLRVTPLIGNNGIVTLEIIQETTAGSPTANTDGNNQNVNLVNVLSKSRTVTKVHVPDGFFVILSGLIRDLESRFENRVPCLGGIPIIGGLCKQKINTDTKQNLMLFIRPLIIDTDDDLEDITKRQQDVFCEKSKFRRMWNYEIDEALDYFNVKPTDPDEIGCAGCNQ